MKQFRAIYYPNAECSPLTLAKAILVFDELVFYDHTSINFRTVGTVGHESHMRHIAPLLLNEGYSIKIVEPLGGPIEDEIKELIDADLQNREFRKTFFKLIQNDPSFLMSKVHDGNYGIYGNGNEYRKRIVALNESEVPSSAEAIGEFKITREGGMPPELNVAVTMALDSFNLNFAAFMAIDEDLHLLGDSRGMDLLLKAKFADTNLQKAADKGIAEAIAFSMLEHSIPSKAFVGKKFADVVRFRNKTETERERFKERILQLTIELQDLTGAEKRKKVDELIYKVLLPELRSFQEKQLKNWDAFFTDSTKSVLHSARDIAQEVAQTLPLSLAAGLGLAAARIGIEVMPHLIDYLVAKKKNDRLNPYAYLMKFS